MNSKAPKNFAPVVPLNIAAYLREMGMLGGYHLLLAHDVLENPDGYKEIYRPYTDGTPMEIIMDNSLIELGYPMMMEDVLQAAKIVGAKKVVLPDELGKFEETLEATRRSMEEWLRLPLHETAGIRPVGVVQGKTLSECITCLREFHKLGIDISIPRVLHKYLGSRAEIITIAHMHYEFQNIHLLGFSEDILDDITCTRLPGVRGIDSAVPIRAAYRDLILDPLDPTFDHQVGPRGNYWGVSLNELSGMQMHLMQRNIMLMNSWINR